MPVGATKPPKDLTCGVPHSAFPFASWQRRRAGQEGRHLALRLTREVRAAMDSPREGSRRVLSTLLQENTETHWEVFTLKG